MCIDSALQAILTSGQVPPDLLISYDDMHGLWGGTTITIQGDGKAERLERAIGGDQPRVCVTVISQSQLLELIRLLLDLKAWEQQTPESMMVPDESRAHLKISLSGQVSDIWERFNEMAANNRLMQIKAKLVKLTGAEKHL